MTIYFHNMLLRGNRSTKFDTGALDAFRSTNLPPLAELEVKIKGCLLYYFVPFHGFTQVLTRHRYLSLRMLPKVWITFLYLDEERAEPFQLADTTLIKRNLRWRKPKICQMKYLSHSTRMLISSRTSVIIQY